MCKDHDKAVIVANKFIQEKNKFKYDEIIDALRKNAGTTWLGPYYHISDFLSNMVKWRVLKREGEYFVKIT